MSVRVSHVVAVAMNGVIGLEDELPWRLPSDLKRFKQITMGKPVVMGRKTWESIGRPLSGRANIVVTRSSDFSVKGVRVASSIDGAMELAHSLALDMGADEICIIGGGEIYRQTLPATSRIYLTRVMTEMAGDTYYPELDMDEWEEVAREHHIEGPNDTADFDLITLERTQ